jgi:hypothetical protein
MIIAALIRMAKRIGAIPRRAPATERHKSRAHIKAAATKRTRWIAKRDAMTARLAAGL